MIQGLNPGRCKRCFHLLNVQTSCEGHQTCVHWVAMSLSLGVKWMGLDVDH